MAVSAIFLFVSKFSLRTLIISPSFFINHSHYVADNFQLSLHPLALYVSIIGDCARQDTFASLNNLLWLAYCNMFIYSYLFCVF